MQPDGKSLATLSMKSAQSRPRDFLLLFLLALPSFFYPIVEIKFWPKVWLGQRKKTPWGDGDPKTIKLGLIAAQWETVAMANCFLKRKSSNFQTKTFICSC